MLGVEGLGFGGVTMSKGDHLVLKQAYPLGFLALPAPLVRGRTVPAAPGVV
jgi:hypothetical protein